MNEERLSRALYEAAVADRDVAVLSWQGVDGKGYFAADIKIRLPDLRRIEPDLILALRGTLWLIEIKGRHVEAISDERKLAEAVGLLGESGILRQVEVRSGAETADADLALAVAYFGDGSQDEPSGRLACVSEVIHLDWNALRRELPETGLSDCLDAAYRARQRRT